MWFVTDTPLGLYYRIYSLLVNAVSCRMLKPWNYCCISKESILTHNSTNRAGPIPGTIPEVYV